MKGYGDNSATITVCYLDGCKIQRLFAAIDSMASKKTLDAYRGKQTGSKLLGLF